MKIMPFKYVTLIKREGSMFTIIVYLIATFLILISLILMIKNQFTKPNNNAMLPTTLLLIASLILLLFNLIK